MLGTFDPGAIRRAAVRSDEKENSKGRTMTPLTTAVASATDVGAFLTWGVFGIQVGNLLVIIAIVVLFSLALVAPFPKGRSHR